MRQPRPNKPHIFWYRDFFSTPGWRYFPARTHAYNVGMNMQANDWCVVMSGEWPW